MRYVCIKTSTYGLVFFATPHSGASKASVGKFVANIASSVTGTPTNSLLDQLQERSFLNEMTLDLFSEQTSDYEILSYFETKRTDITVKIKFFGKWKLSKRTSIVSFVGLHLKTRIDEVDAWPVHCR